MCIIPPQHEQLTKQELGGVGVCDQSGAVDVVVANERLAFAAARRFLSYLPSRVADRLPRHQSLQPAGDSTLLRGIVSNDATVSFDIYSIIELIVDK
jgi:acetyl-CoA carboxylase carboxyltransferase component